MIDRLEDIGRLTLAAVDGVATTREESARRRGRPKKAATAPGAAVAPAADASVKRTVRDYALAFFQQAKKELTHLTSMVFAIQGTGTYPNDPGTLEEIEKRRQTLAGIAAKMHPQTLEEVKSKARMAAQCPMIFASLMADLLDQR